MAQLTTQQRQEVRAAIASQFSSSLTPIPVTKSEMLAIVDACDVALETAESGSQAALVTGAATWMLANPTLLRDFLRETQDKRKEVL